jgi:cytochrome c-type biogenesis protein
MHAWIARALEAPGTGITVLGALFVLGMLSAAASSCCSLPVIGAITGYAGTGEVTRRRDIAIAALSFGLGSIVALAAIGAGMGYAGQIVGVSFTRYSRLVVGFVLIVFGLMSLGFSPWRLPALRVPGTSRVRGIPGAVILGSALGGSSATCAVSCCSPALLAVLGAVAAQGQAAKGALLMAVFGAGFSLPLIAVLLGASLGRWALRATRVMPVVKIIAGIAMLGVGFYFLASI